MLRDPSPSGRLVPSSQGSAKSRAFWPIAMLAGALGSALAVGLLVLVDSSFERAANAKVAAADPIAERLKGMVALPPALGVDALTFEKNRPLAAGFASLVEPHDMELDGEAAESAAVAAAARSAQISLPQVVPLPMRRPADLGVTNGADASRQVRTAAAPPAPEAEQSLLEKLFGVKPGQGTGLGALLGFAAIPGDPSKDSPDVRTSPSIGPQELATAVYDITAKVVIMPNGEKMEAHSGLGEYMDDPRYVHVRMRGATPPGVYNLTEREALFHGVRALRMNPVGGSAAIHGRAGILTHTYLLGPNGDSNGCISFKDYDRFLQAYLRGDVKRIVVVARGGEDVLPAMARAKGDLRSVVALNGR